MNSKFEKYIFYFFLFVLVIIQIILLFLNEKVYEGTDNVTHFQIARFAFKYPELFLDSWGKPVYTTLVAPFALLGFKAAQLFNLAVAVVTMFFVFQISKYIFPSGAIFTVVLTAFAPVYFLLMITCLTEVLFSLFLVVTVYLFLKNRLLFSAIVLSFIPFVRTEGIVLFPIFAFAFILRRSYLSIPLLTVGALFFSVIGYFVFDDFLWIINRFPYPTGESVYGSGELLHFVKHSNFIFGIPLILFTITGLFYWIKEILKNFKLNSEVVVLFVIIVGSWMTYFAAHSYVWWKGVGGSLGLIRVIGAVIPLAALTGVKFFQPVLGKDAYRKSGIIALSFLSLLQIGLFFNQNKLPFKNGPVENLINTASEYVKQNFSDEKIYYFNPDFAFQLGLDPYDETKSNWGIGDKMKPSNSMELGAVLIWDAHFGPNEGGVSLEVVEKDNRLQRIKTFVPLEKITVLGGYDYSIQVFQKVNSKIRNGVSDVLKRSLEMDSISSSQIILLEGENVLEIPKGHEYSPNIVIYADELLKKDIFEGEVNIRFKSDENIVEKDVMLVFSVENGKESLHYSAVPLVLENNDSDWKSTKLSTRFTANLPEETIIKIYVWNRNHKHILVQSMDSFIYSY